MAGELYAVLDENINDKATQLSQRINGRQLPSDFTEVGGPLGGESWVVYL